MASCWYSGAVRRRITPAAAFAGVTAGPDTRRDFTAAVARAGRLAQPATGSTGAAGWRGAPRHGSLTDGPRCRTSASATRARSARKVSSSLVCFDCTPMDSTARQGISTPSKAPVTLADPMRSSEPSAALNRSPQRFHGADRAVRLARWARAAAADFLLHRALAQKICFRACHKSAKLLDQRLAATPQVNHGSTSTPVPPDPRCAQAPHEFDSVGSAPDQGVDPHRKSVNPIAPLAGF